MVESRVVVEGVFGDREREFGCWFVVVVVVKVLGLLFVSFIVVGSSLTHSLTHSHSPPTHSLCVCFVLPFR